MKFIKSMLINVQTKLLTYFHYLTIWTLIDFRFAIPSELISKISSVKLALGIGATKIQYCYTKHIEICERKKL